MATLDQKRAQLAFKHIRDVSDWDDKSKKKYASIVYAMPALLRSAGLSQALHFVRSKSTEQQLFLDHLAKQLERVDAGIDGSTEKLLAKVREAELSEYLRLTHEALACVVWYRRFVQGELGIEAGETDVRVE